MSDYLTRTGYDWLADQIDGITTSIDIPPIVDYLQENRYLPASVTSMPGYMDYGVNPFMVEIVECFHPDSPVREVNLMKGVQMTYTVGALEAILMYYMTCLKVYPCMFMSADAELVQLRIENNILPMLQQSGFADVLQSNDMGNSRKTGQTKKLLQWAGGGFMVPAGAKNADKLRSHSILLLIKDEIDAWAQVVGKDGCPDVVSDSRCDAFEAVRKILRGSTPLHKGTSKIDKRYRQGDQRRYLVLCRSCNFPQPIDWRHRDKHGKLVPSFTWELEQGTLVQDSVSWICSECSHKHYNSDKELLLSLDEGAHWNPTARPIAPDIRSYHLPAFYSPIGMKSWAGCVQQYLNAYDVKEKKIINVAEYQTFYNNILGKPFAVIGEKVRFEHVSGHRRGAYHFGQIPNKFARDFSGSPILFLTMEIDVQEKFLAVSIFGWCKNSIPYTIDYWYIEDENCTLEDSPAWSEVDELIVNKKYEADDGLEYGIFCTLIDSRYAQDTVVKFCSNFDGWVFPIMGRDRPAKASRIMEFDDFETKLGTKGYYITVDHYKDRLSPVLRRNWTTDAGEQRPYHFNAPIDITDKQLKELTVETKRKKTDPTTGMETYYWHRPSGTRNELWDLLVYGHANVEIIAYIICVDIFEIEESIDWPRFWDYMAERLEPKQD